MISYAELLRSKGFEYEGGYWVFIEEHNNTVKEKICKIFKVYDEVISYGVGINIVILQCSKDFTECIFYCDGRYYTKEIHVDAKYFMMCVGKI